MKFNFFSALRLTAVLLILCSGLYTLVIYAAAQFVPGKGRGEMVSANGKSYYANIGQSFTDDKYFQGRPSAVNYNAAGSGGSNKGPYNKEYLATVKTRIDTFLAHNLSVKVSDIPVELVTASGSGLDPDISPKAAMVQIDRISLIRKIPVSALASLIEKHTTKPWLGIMGPEKINVLKLNIALDQINKSKPIQINN
jgi:potassium-transporting ATPase KdpC subunit